MDNATARVIGAIYLALTNAIDAGSSGAAHDTLIRLADSPDLPAEDRRIYGLIAHSTMLSPEEAERERENAELDAAASRPMLRVIQGGKSDETENFAWFARVAAH